MTPRERFQAVLHFTRPDDRLPLIEWAPWWDQTLARWEGEGLPAGLSAQGSQAYFGLDPMILLEAAACSPRCPQPPAHGAGLIANEADYEALLPLLYTDEIIERLLAAATAIRDRHRAGEIIARLWLDGFFWFPRTLLGIERHLYAFFDQPELLHRINRDLATFNLRAVEAVCEVLTPDLVGLAEDMSYNRGPMLSRRHFRQFLLPYYQALLPAIKKRGIAAFVDSDGDITVMIPWLEEAGIEGVYPLERQAGVDVAAIREQHPSFLIMGGYDKMVMPKGEAVMRAEFERLLPVMRGGGYIASVDHQTPPGVSLAEYRCYLRLFDEYARRAIT